MTGDDSRQPQSQPVLAMRGINKTFGPVKALRGVSLTLYPGEVHALVGENGAGKSTLMKILSGAYVQDPGGEILIDGQVVRIDGPLAARRLGVSVIYQELALCASLTVAENIYLNHEIRKAGTVNRAAMERGCADILTQLGATFGPRTLVGDLSIAERQLVEIAKSMLFHCRILVMDEPTTPLSSRETEKLFDLIRRLRAQGMAIVYVSHRMAEVFELSDKVTVLRDGTYVGTLTREDLSAERLVRMMVGRDLSGFYRKERNVDALGPVVMTVRDMANHNGRVLPCSFELHRGEVLGIAGLVGSGRTELARLIFGADARKSGDVVLDGQPANARHPLDALDAGIVYLTEDRKAQGLFLDISVADNINACACSRDAHPAGVLDLGKARARAQRSVKSLAIRVANVAMNVGSLSGGNQQKVLLARLLETSPKVLILDEPTRGVDIGAKSEIYRIINDLAKTGVGIIVISSELPEIIGTADRVLIMREGQLVGEVGGHTGIPITQEYIIRLATGAGATDTLAA